MHRCLIFLPLRSAAESKRSRMRCSNLGFEERFALGRLASDGGDSLRQRRGEDAEQWLLFARQLARQPLSLL